MKLSEIIKQRLLGKIVAEFVEEGGETFLLFDAIRLDAGAASQIIGITYMWKGQELTNIKLERLMLAGDTLHLHFGGTGRIEVQLD